MAKTPHLRDLFVTGMPVNIDLYDPTDPDNTQTINLWMRKPSAQHYEEALGKARGKQGRRRQLYRDPNSDEFLALNEQIAELDTKDRLVEELLAFQKADLQSRAYNEALYGDADEDEPRWGKEGADYLDVLAGLRDRHDEIEAHNASLAEEDVTLKIKVEEDEEVLRLNAYLDEFTEMRNERLEKLEARARAVLEAKTMDTLRKELMKEMIDLEVKLVHYQEFKTLMVFFASRYPDDHHKFYFSNADEIWDLPDFVRIQLFDAYDKLEQGADQLKNSPSPQPS